MKRHNGCVELDPHLTNYEVFTMNKRDFSKALVVSFVLFFSAPSLAALGDGKKPPPAVELQSSSWFDSLMDFFK